MVARSRYVEAGACLAALLSVIVAVRPVHADVSDPALQIMASNATGTGVFQVTSDQLNFSDGVYSWSGSNIVIEDGAGDAIALIQSVSVAFRQDPVITLFFDVLAGGTDTFFSISSGLLSFPAIQDPNAAASVGMTLTDSDVSGSASLVGATSTGNGFAYVAQYNGLVPGGTTFVEAISGMSVNVPAGSTSDSFNSGFSIIPGAVSSMSAEIAFQLSANDSASGTSVYAIIPEPGALMLLAAGAGVLVARRRRSS